MQDIAEIFKIGIELKNKFFNGYTMTLDHLTLFSNDQTAYEQMVLDNKSIGSLQFEDDRGSMFKLTTPIQYQEFALELLKVAKPNVHKHLGHNSAIYFKVEDFSDFSKSFGSLSAEGVVKQQLPNKFELLDTKSTTALFIIPQDSPAIEDIEEVLEKTLQEKDVERLKAQLAEEQFKRIQQMADFQNYQKRIEQEKSSWAAMSNMSLIKEILEVYDDLHLALNDSALEIEHAKQSIKSAQDKLVMAVNTTGLEVIDVKVGDEFDKDKMEAVSTIAVEDESKKNKVIAVISSAFKFKSKDFILKPAKVVVGK